MAIDSVEKRLDDMVGQRTVTSRAPGIEVSYLEKTPEPLPQDMPVDSDATSAEIAEQSSEQAPEEVKVQASPITKAEQDDEALDMSQGVLVAGVGDVARTVFKGMKKKGKTQDGRVEPTMGDQAPAKIDADPVFEPATPEQVQATQAAIQARALARETGAETTRKPPEEAFNTTRMPDDIADIINGTADALGIERKATTFGEIQSLADKLGVNKKYINHLINDSGQVGGEAAEVLRAMQVQEESAVMLQKMFEKVDSGQANEIDKLALAQQIALHQRLQDAVKGVKAEKARAMAIMRTPRDASVDRIRKLLEDGTGTKNIEALARQYINATNLADKNLMLERSFGKNMLDLWFTIRVNGLLSNPDTWARGFVGPALFGMYRIPERMLAGAFSKMPESLRLSRGNNINPFSPKFKEIFPYSNDELQTLEVFSAEFFATAQSTKNAIKRAATAFQKNSPLDPNTQLELGANYDSSFSAEAFKLAPNSMMGRGVNYLGKAVTLPGRVMLTSDEFYKGYFSNHYIAQVATNRGRQAYKDAIENGADEATAAAAMDSTVRSIRADPPEDVLEGAIEAGRRATFTSDIPGILGKVEKIVQTPIVKTFVPFYRTPTNEMLEVLERTPFAPLSQRWRNDMAKGGPSRDMALAKASLATLYMTGYVMFAMEGTVIGNYIGTKADREAFERSGGQYNSLVFDGQMFTSDQAKRLASVFKVSVTADKTYIGIGNLGVPAVLAVAAADYAAFAKYSQDKDVNAEVAGGLISTAYHFLNDVPALDLLSQLFKLTTDLKEGEIDTDGFIDGLIAEAAKIGISGTPAGINSSMMSAIEKYADGTKSDINMNDVNVHPVFKGFYTAGRKYSANNPYLSGTMEVPLNLWGGRNMQPYVPPDEIMMPTGITFTEFSAIDKELLRLGNPIREPDYKIQGAKITSAQRNQLIKIFNKEFDGKKRLEDAISTSEYQLMTETGQRGLQQARLRQIYEEAMSAAEEVLISRDVSLQRRLEIGKDRKQGSIFAKPPN